ncbi:hypothetical protein WICPIJ_003356 [Wickerhamomyces pijperi]|uniref:Uncharacterized protein n=1 Tax=Wickerhamomyces pijperi TaxID=599730 RepID=A0A9P8Q801_WICPI|nr:hypothetical protein WICPIJ_003356 [Wickerhamomyces pijperi]
MQNQAAIDNHLMNPSQSVLSCQVVESGVSITDERQILFAATRSSIRITLSFSFSLNKSWVLRDIFKFISWEESRICDTLQLWNERSINLTDSIPINTSKERMVFDFLSTSMSTKSMLGTAQQSAD